MLLRVCKKHEGFNSVEFKELHMFGSALTYDVYHLGMYLGAIILWSLISLVLLFNARRIASRLAMLGCVLTPPCAIALCIGILLIDVWAVIDHRTVIVSLLTFGLVVPLIFLALVYRFFLRRKVV